MLAEYTVGVIRRWVNNDHSYAGADDCQIVLFLSAETLLQLQFFITGRRGGA